MYTTLLTMHSWVRWVALVAGVGATLWALRRDDRRADAWGLVMTGALDFQLVLGLFLYFVVSPNMQVVREHLGEAMRTPGLRFWAVEHVAAMLLAVVLAHVGRVLGRRAKSLQAKRSRQLLGYGLATILMVAGMPWPGRVSGRPFFRV